MTECVECAECAECAESVHLHTCECAVCRPPTGTHTPAHTLPPTRCAVLSSMRLWFGENAARTSRPTLDRVQQPFVCCNLGE